MSNQRVEEKAQMTFKSTVTHDAGVAYAVESLTAAKTLTVHDSGKIFMLNLAAGFDVTLPSATAADIAGCVFTFIHGTLADGGANYGIVGGTADKLAGLVIASSGGNEDSEAAITGDTVNFVTGTSTVGDMVEIICDGTGYYALAFCDATGAILIEEE